MAPLLIAVNLRMCNNILLTVDVRKGGDAGVDIF